MAFKFNPFTSNFDDVADVAEKLEVTGNTPVTDNSIVRFDGTTGRLVQDSAVTIDDLGNVVIAGNVTVNGETTTLNTQTLDVEDTNISVNVNGTDVSAEGAGVTVERVGVNGSFVYEDSLTSKFKIGPLGSEVEVADISNIQTFTNKTIDADSNTILDLSDTNISNTAAISFSKMQALTADRVSITSMSGVITTSDITVTELNFLDNLTENVQVSLDSKAIITDSYSTNSISANTTLVNFETYLVDSSTALTLTLPAPTLDAFIIVKDSTGTSNTNNITINTTSTETIDGEANLVINSNFESTTLVSDGTNWFIL